MIKAIQNKLHSQTGASLLIALLYFLTALMVGAVVLTAAATNAGRLGRNRQEQQNYLAVASAAQLVQEDLRDTVFTVGYTKTITEVIRTENNSDGSSHTTVEYLPPVYAKVDPALSPKNKLLAGNPTAENPMNDLANLYYYLTQLELEKKNESGASFDLSTTAPTDMEYKLEFTVKDLPDLPIVKGVLEVGKEISSPPADKTLTAENSTLTVKLYIEEEVGKQTNAMTLLFTPTIKQTTSSLEVTPKGSGETDYVTTYTTEITWDTCVVTKGAGI